MLRAEGQECTINYAAATRVRFTWFPRYRWMRNLGVTGWRHEHKHCQRITGNDLGIRMATYEDLGFFCSCDYAACRTWRVCGSRAIMRDMTIHLLLYSTYCAANPRTPIRLTRRSFQQVSLKIEMFASHLSRGRFLLLLGPEFNVCLCLRLLMLTVQLTRICKSAQLGT